MALIVPTDLPFGMTRIRFALVDALLRRLRFDVVLYVAATAGFTGVTYDDDTQPDVAPTMTGMKPDVMRPGTCVMAVPRASSRTAVFDVAGPARRYSAVVA